jgi:endoglucanase
MEQPAPQAVSHAHLPRWRGFNLMEKFQAASQRPFAEEDFDLMAGWGFDFTRLPMDYRCWTDPRSPYERDEKILKEIDQAVAWGRARRIHVNLNLHRAPGFCCNPPAEERDLWTDAEALKQCAHHWREFAQRYRGIPNAELSFDLLNEPTTITEEAYVRVVRELVAAIRAADPDRLIIADGLLWGTKPVPALIGLKIAQSTRGYSPNEFSQYRAEWLKGSTAWPEPTWPLTTAEGRWDRARLLEENIKPWQALAARGVGVHVGEWGVYHRTPHPATLAFMRDRLELWQAAGWGWALWQLRGGFGVLDSDRADVQYETLGSHHLDRAMLELLRAY